MTVCPFCKKAGPSSHGPCESCGRVASDHPSVRGSSPGGAIDGGWGDDDLGDGNFDLSRGSGVAGAPQQSAYSGGSVGFDDDPFAEAVPDGALELDIPSHHSANTPRAMPVEPPQPPKAPSLPTPPRSDPSLRAGPKPGRASDPALAAAPPPPSDPRPPPPSSQPSANQSGPHPAYQTGPHPAQQQPLEPPPDSARALPPAPRTPDPAALIARYPTPPAKIWEAPLYAMRVIWRQIELRQDLESLRRKRSPDVPLYERALKTHDARTFALGLAITCAGLAIASFVFFLPVILRFMRDTD